MPDRYSPDPRSVLQVEAELRRLSDEMNRHTTDLIRYSQDWAEAKHRYEQERASRYLVNKSELADEKPTIPEIEAYVQLDVADQHHALLVAEARMKAERQVCQAIIAQLDALRSINANARAAADFTRGEGG